MSACACAFTLVGILLERIGLILHYLIEVAQTIPVRVRGYWVCVICGHFIKVGEAIPVTAPQRKGPQQQQYNQRLNVPKR
jgi:hypothetical protein